MPSYPSHVQVNPESMRQGVHETHRLFLCHYMVFCDACGYWRMSLNRPARKLAEPCPGQPKKESAAQLRRILSGYHPQTNGHWPDGTPAAHQYPTLRLDGDRMIPMHFILGSKDGTRPDTWTVDPRPLPRPRRRVPANHPCNSLVPSPFRRNKWGFGRRVD